MSDFPYQETISSYASPLSEITVKWKVQLLFSSIKMINDI